MFTNPAPPVPLELTGSVLPQIQARSPCSFQENSGVLSTFSTEASGICVSETVTSSHKQKKKKNAIGLFGVCAKPERERLEVLLRSSVAPLLVLPNQFPPRAAARSPRVGPLNQRRL